MVLIYIKFVFINTKYAIFFKNIYSNSVLVLFYNTNSDMPAKIKTTTSSAT